MLVVESLIRTDSIYKLKRREQRELVGVCQDVTSTSGNAGYRYGTLR